jgi:hypothetical protein
VGLVAGDEDFRVPGKTEIGSHHHTSLTIEIGSQMLAE